MSENFSKRRTSRLLLSTLVVVLTSVVGTGALTVAVETPAAAAGCAATSLTLTSSLSPGWAANKGPATLSATLSPSSGCGGLSMKWSTVENRAGSSYGWYCTTVACPESSGIASTTSTTSSGGVATSSYTTGSRCVTLVATLTAPSLVATLEPGALAAGGDCYNLFASRLVFTTQPGGATAGQPFAPQPRVSLEDFYGNVVQGSSASVTLKIRRGGGTLSGCAANPVHAVAGVASYAGCTIGTAGTYSLQATASGIFFGGTSANVTMTSTSHTATFNANGGTGTMAPEVSSVPRALTLNAFTRPGYTFAGWNTAANGSRTAYANGGTYSFSASVTLYAQWAANSTRTVTFNANSGSGSMAPETSNVPTALTLNAFGKPGYTFAGWNTAANGSGTSYANGAVYGFTANAVLYAQWTALPTHTVTFNANLGTGSMPNEVSNVAEGLTANAFTRAGYTFSS
jgi:uncharacterized repeat protein (TIGR02543 family)